MKLLPYLKARDESQGSFSRRAKLPLATVNEICREVTIPRADTADRVIDASREEPAPDGGTVTLKDLLLE